MVKIMFVCHGNICRSPMAEFVFKKLLVDNGIQESFFVSSSATSTEEIFRGIGNPVYPPAKAELLKHGISCEGKKAVQLKPDDYEKYDIFIGMDSANIRNMMKIFNVDKENKIYKLLSFTNDCRDVDDPWYSGDFKQCYDDIYSGCTALLKRITEGTLCNLF